jgi:hypothetical protein
MGANNLTEGSDTMTDLSIDLIEYLDKLSMEPDADLLRDSLKMVVQLLTDGVQLVISDAREGFRLT